MLEWLKRHAWKACILQKGIPSSNLGLSANQVHSRLRKQLAVFGSGPIKNLFSLSLPRVEGQNDEGGRFGINAHADTHPDTSVIHPAYGSWWRNGCVNMKKLRAQNLINSNPGRHVRGYKQGTMYKGM